MPWAADEALNASTVCQVSMTIGSSSDEAPPFSSGLIVTENGIWHQPHQ